MSSRSQRQATAVWLLADALTGASADPGLKPIRVAAERVRPCSLEIYDRPMRRVQGGLMDLLNSVLVTGADGFLSNEYILAYLHLLTAVVGDQWRECPDRPADRKRNWRRLNNAIAEYIQASDPTGDIGVEMGCDWADRVKEILNHA